MDLFLHTALSDVPPSEQRNRAGRQQTRACHLQHKGILSTALYSNQGPQKHGGDGRVDTQERGYGANNDGGAEG